MRKVDGRTNKSGANTSTSQAYSGRQVYKLVGDIEPEVKIIQSDNVLGFKKSGDITSERVRLRYSKHEKNQIKSQQKNSFIKKEGIIFEWGRLIVIQRDEPNLITFLSQHYGNTINGGQEFYLDDPEAQVQASTDRDDAVSDAKLEIRKKLETDAGINELRQVARGLRIASHSGSIASLKADLYKACSDNPDNVLKAFDDKMIKAKAYVDIAFSIGELQYAQNKVSWNGGSSFMSVPTGKNVNDEVAIYACQPMNLDFFKEVEKLALKQK